MAVLLDAYAAIAFLRGEPAAKEVGRLLEQGEAVMHPLNVGEVLDRMSRLNGADPDDVEADLALAGVHPVDVDPVILVDAGRWRGRHYHRKDRPVSLADCVAGLSAVVLDLPFATSDRSCAEMVREEGGEVLALPDTRGRRP